MHPLVSALLATSLLCLVSLVGVFFAGLGTARLRTVVFVLVAFAAGALLSAAFFHLLPEAYEHVGYLGGSTAVLVGLSSFFVLERFLHWRHCHDGHCDGHPYTTLSLMGGALHNLLDGFVIGGSFLVSPGLGVSTTVVIIAHALRQELGDFGILVHGGYGKARALLLNFLTSLPSLAGAALAYYGMVGRTHWIPYLMGFAAGTFIYVGSSDLIPEIHKEQNLRKTALAFAFFILAVLLLLFVAMHGEHEHL